MALAATTWTFVPTARCDTPLPGQKEEKRGDKGASAEAAKEAEMLKAKGEKDQPKGEGVEPQGPAVVKVDAGAKEELNQIKEAYGKLSSLQLKGNVNGTFDVAGQKGAPKAEFSSSFPKPEKLWTIDDLGGWSDVNTKLFDAEDGSIIKLYDDLTQ